MAKLRSKFTDAEIAEAWLYAGGSGKAAAEWLTRLGRGQVYRQLAQRWALKLGVHQPRKRNGSSPYVSLDGPRVLLIDIETCPITGYVWSLWKQNIGLNQVKADWNILSFCAKWLGSDEIIYEDVRDNPADDRPLLASIYKLLDEADIVIGQNGKRFDVPKIQARLVMNKYLPPSPFKVVDTMLMAKQQFAFTSNRLEYLTGVLCTEQKDKHKDFPGFELWEQCLAGNMAAWDAMREYNIPDVTLMEELYLILRPWYVGHPNVAIYFDDDVCRCPKCASTAVKQEGWTYTQSGKYERIHCGGCGGWSRGRYTRNTTAVRKAQLSN